MPAPYQNPAMASYPTPSPQDVDTGLVYLLISWRGTLGLSPTASSSGMSLVSRVSLAGTRRCCGLPGGSSPSCGGRPAFPAPAGTPTRPAPPPGRDSAGLAADGCR